MSLVKSQPHQKGLAAGENLARLEDQIRERMPKYHEQSVKKVIRHGGPIAFRKALSAKLGRDLTVDELAEKGAHLRIRDELLRMGVT